MYHTLAKFYEKLNDNCDQDQWSHYLISLLKKHAGKSPSGLSGADLGCGTGVLTAKLARECGIGIACDLSAEMLNEASKNLSAARLRIPLVQSDFRAFRAPKKLDFLLVVNDGINYVPSAELEVLFRHLRGQLKKGGLLLFDLSSAHKLGDLLGDNLFFDDGEDLSMFWQCAKERDAVRFELTFFEREGELFRRFEESQIQYIHTNDRVEAALAAAGFGSVTAYDAFTERPPREESLRIQFVAENV